MDKEKGKLILEKTIDDYNRIAPLWSTKRWKLPSDIIELGKYIDKDDEVLDLGCGNGYFYDVVIQKEAIYTGADVSEEQLKICKKLHPEGKFIQTDSLNLPFEDNSFDKVFCLSTIHHIAGNKLQLQFLKEIYRVTDKDGIFALTAWNLDSDKKEILYPFKNEQGETVVERYIYIFNETELKDLAAKAGFDVTESRIVKRGYGKFTNILIIARKKN